MARRPGRLPGRSTRWLPRLGRSVTSGTRPPAQTPVALTTPRALTVRLAAGQLVAQGHLGAGGVQHPRPGADVGAVPGGRARDGGDQPGVVLELAVPGEQAAAQAGAAQPRGVLQGLGGGDPARPRQRRPPGVRAEPQQVAGEDAGAHHRRVPVRDAGGERQHPRHRAGQVRGRHLHQQAALDGALVRHAELPLGEVAQAAVHELGGPPRGAEGQVVRVDGQHGEPAGDRVERGPGARSPRARRRPGRPRRAARPARRR